MTDLQTLFGYLTPISLTIGVIYHIMTLNNTRRTQQIALETRQAQLFMNIYDQYRDKEFQRDIATIYNVWEWEDYDDFQEKYGRKSTPEAYSSYTSVSNFFEGIGVLINRKLIDPSLVEDLIGGPITRYWERVESLVIESRERRKWPQMSEWFEYLYNVIKPLRYEQTEHPELGT